MGIKAFIFDCGGVLLGLGDGSAYDRWEARLNLPKLELGRQLWESEAWRLAEIGKISDAELWTRVGAQVGLTDASLVTQMRDDIWETWDINPQVLALVDRIRQTHRVAMLSNSTDALEEILANRYHVADRFEAIFNSARLGLAKPDPTIYTEVLRKMELKPADVVFIDDRAENITAAAALGMHVAWYVNAAELERQLATYLAASGEPAQ